METFLHRYESRKDTPEVFGLEIFISEEITLELCRKNNFISIPQLKNSKMPINK